MTLDIPMLLLVSIPVGFVGALTGLGGASILVPLMVLFGIPVKEAIASAMVSVVATSSGSASAYVRERITNARILTVLFFVIVIPLIVQMLYKGFTSW